MKVYYHCSECHIGKPEEEIAEMHWNTNEFEPALDVKIICNKCKEEMNQ